MATAMAAEAGNSSTVQHEKLEAEDTTKKLDKMSISFSIWPPTQRTRDAVTKRLIETLSATSILSKRYGTIPPEEATGIAERIEDEAFTAASASSVSSDDDGIEILQAYSKEISKRMLDYMKSRSPSVAVSSALDEEGGATTTAIDSAAQDAEGATVET